MADEYDYEKMVQRIKSNKSVLLYLQLFYTDEIDDWHFQEELTECCCKNGVSEDTAYAMYFAARIPGEACYEKIMKKIEEIEFTR